MDQLHKRFTNEQVRVLLQGYCQGIISRSEIQELLGTGKTRFFALLKAYRRDPSAFSLAYRRATPPRISAEVETAMAIELLRDKALIEDPRLPITDYNYSALRDRLHKQGIQVSLTTIINRAKQLGCYRPQKPRKTHDREVLTAAIGALIQHDASLHLWSPCAEEKWYLVTSIDDYSRMLLYADFVPKETSWVHILAVRSLILTYGIPVRYYVDSLRVFRFVQGRDSVWRRHVLQTDDVETQWQQMMHLLGIEVTHALSPQAKGKVERPYRWLQDRIVRTCALENIGTLQEARSVLSLRDPVGQEEVQRYNHHQVHSTTGEIPTIRFEKATQASLSLFRPFSIPKPYNALEDVFCLRLRRMVDGYRRISLFNHTIEVPHVPLRENVDLHLVPDVLSLPNPVGREIMHIRVWWNEQLVHTVDLPLQGFTVHF